MIKTPKKSSRKVLEFETIARDARLMNKLLRDYVDPRGKSSSQHYAIHHSQFSNDPYNFFVVNPSVVEANPGDIVVVVNPKIISKDRSTKKTVKESCMSFPFRDGKNITRYETIEVSYQVPVEDGKKMKLKEETMSGFMAQIFQHEVEHAHGSHIYEVKK